MGPGIFLGLSPLVHRGMVQLCTTGRSARAAPGHYFRIIFSPLFPSCHFLVPYNYAAVCIWADQTFQIKPMCPGTPVFMSGLETSLKNVGGGSGLCWIFVRRTFACLFVGWLDCFLFEAFKMHLSVSWLTVVLWVFQGLSLLCSS